MVGTTAQMASLVSYGNGYLINKRIDKWHEAHTTFKFCYSVVFELDNLTGRKETSNPADWFEYLKEGGCRKLRLFYQASQNNDSKYDYSTAGFIGGGGYWFIEAVYENSSDLWMSGWVVNGYGKDDGKPWEVTYKKTHSNIPTINMQGNLITMKAEFAKALSKIEEFAEREAKGPWAEIFRKSIEELNSDNPEFGYHADLIIRDYYALESRQLLAAELKAWVFGGMGSWNDMYFENKEASAIYKIVSQNLYTCVCKSIVFGYCK